MSISYQQAVNGRWVVSVSGRLDQSQSMTLETTLNEILEHETPFVIIDLDETNYINSGGLRCLVSAWRRAKQLKGNLILCCLNSRLLEIFSMVGFDKVFQIFPTRAAAIETVLSP